MRPGSLRRTRPASELRPVYLFQPRGGAQSRPGLDQAPQEPDLPLEDATRTRPNTAEVQPGSAAEWALAELLIRVCNGGRGLRAEPPVREPVE